MKKSRPVFSGSVSNFGYAKTNPNAQLLETKDQKQSLLILAEMAERATVDPLVRNTAVLLVQDCASRDDRCELEAIFDAVKYGDPRVKPLRRGLKYIADPNYADYFESPVDMLNQCLRGACGSDCDGHTGLIVALCGSLGWTMGLRAYGSKGTKGFSHVYAVAAYPKKRPSTEVVGMDTTVAQAKPGWEPPPGEVLTAWLL